MSFKVLFNDETKIFDKKIKLIDICGHDKNIIGASVNGIIRSLDYELSYDAKIEFLTLNDHSAVGIYERSIRYLFSMAAYLLYPDIRFRLTYSVSRSIFAQVTSKKGEKTKYILTEEMANKIEQKMKELVQKDIPLERLRLTTEEAKQICSNFNFHEKLNILKYRKEKFVHFYKCDNYYNYMYGKMVLSTGYLKEFKLRFYTPGLLIHYPRSEFGGKIPPFNDEHVFQETLFRTQEWSNKVGLSYVSQINSKIKSNDLSSVELINLCEARHNRMLCELGEQIEKNSDKIRLICIAGPSSSGKTTFADRLIIELKSRGINPIRISMDDYYKRREDVPRDEFGDYDFESIDALDKELFNEQIVKVLNGEEVLLPTFSFKTNDRIFNKRVKIGPKDPIVIEGIHALTEVMTASVPKFMKFKVYISPQAQINIDNETPISLTDIRLLRRIVRDNSYRNSSAEETLMMWPSVRKGEFKWIYHNQENADYVFDSFLNYELCVLAQHALPLLEQVSKDSKVSRDAERLISLIKYFKPIVEKWIPSNSLIREFIGGCGYRDAK